jgi:hypothetical protein
LEKGLSPLGGRLDLPLFAFCVQFGEALLKSMKSRPEEIGLVFQRLFFIFGRPAAERNAESWPLPTRQTRRVITVSPSAATAPPEKRASAGWRPSGTTGRRAESPAASRHGAHAPRSCSVKTWHCIYLLVIFQFLFSGSQNLLSPESRGVTAPREPISPISRPTIFNEVRWCLHVDHVTLIFAAGGFLKTSPLLPFQQVALGDGDAWTSRSPSECLDSLPNRENLPNQPEQVG